MFEGISREQNRKQNIIRHFLSVTPYLLHTIHGFKNQVQVSAICNLCKRSQLEQHHELVSCIVTKRLFSHFETFLTAISPEILEEKEMVKNIAKNLRNLFTFTIKSIVQRNKWTNFSGMNIEQISNQLTEKIKSEFKTQMKKQICHM